MFISVADYAREHKTSTKQVYDLIHSGKLPYKKIKDKLHILIDDAEGAEDQQASINNLFETEQKEKLRLENELKKEKLKNLQQDTILKRQKQIFTRQQYRRQFVQGVFQCFTESFADLKSFLIQLKLEKQRNKKFQELFKGAINTFEKKLKKYLTEKDKQEQTADEI